MTTTETKFIVCPACEGRGSNGPGFVWTASEVEQEDPDEFMDFQRAIRRGQFDVPCDFCEGNRVVPKKDEHGVKAKDRYNEFLDYEAERAAERRMGC